MRKPVLALLSTALLSTALLFNAGCASNNAAPSDDPLSAAKAAPKPTGEPIVLGLTSQEGGAAAGNWPELRQAAEAAVKYVNTELGGAHGRPLQLETCITNGSPEGSIKCANTILAKKPFAVLGGMEVAGDASMPIYTAAKMPFLGGGPINAAQMTAPNSVQWSGFAIGGLPAMAAHAGEQLQAKKVVVVYPALPGTDGFVEGLMKPVLQATGATDVRMLGADIKQPDKTTVISAATQSDPDAILVIEAGAGCVSYLKAHADLASGVPLLITGNCVEAGFLKAVGSAAEGVYTSDEFLVTSQPDHPDVKVFTHALAAYAPRDIRISAISSAGFTTVMNVYNALTALPADQLTADKVLQHFKSAKNAPNFMSHPFTCDGRIEMAPAVCNTAQLMLQVKGGKLVDLGGGWVDAAQYLR